MSHLSQGYQNDSPAYIAGGYNQSDSKLQSSGEPPPVEYLHPKVTVQQPVNTYIFGEMCPACGSRSISDDFTCLGLCCLVLCFPIGLICCLLLKETSCDRCGKIISY